MLSHYGPLQRHLCAHCIFFCTEPGLRLKDELSLAYMSTPMKTAANYISIVLSDPM